MTRLVRTVMLGLGLTVTVVLGPAGGASAHVHGITPLFRCGGDPAVTGANRTNSTPASALSGGPIDGLIPSTVGKASLGVGDGGFSAPARCVGQS